MERWVDERTEIEREDYVCNSKIERNTPQADARTQTQRQGGSDGDILTLTHLADSLRSDSVWQPLSVRGAPFPCDEHFSWCKIDHVLATKAAREQAVRLAVQSSNLRVSHTECEISLLDFFFSCFANYRNTKILEALKSSMQTEF